MKQELDKCVLVIDEAMPRYRSSPGPVRAIFSMNSP